MKTSTLKTFIFLSIMTSLIWFPNAFAKDSSMGAFQSGTSTVRTTTPSYIYGQPFMIEDGFSDPWNQQNATATGGDIAKKGYMEKIECYAESSSKEAYCVVRAMTYRAYSTNYNTSTTAPEICPVNFLPMYIITPQTTSGATNSFACPAPTSTYGGYHIPTDEEGVPQFDSNHDYSEYGHFWLYAIVSASEDPNTGNLVPKTGFLWQIVCYPTHATTLTLMRPYSSCNNKLQGTRLPQLIELGAMGESSSSASMPRILSTTKKCPSGQKPYVELSMAPPKTYSSSTTDFKLVNSAAYCVQKIATSGDHYNISVLYTTLSTDVQKTSSALTVNDPATPATTFMNIQWKLYCYAPGFDPPFDFTTSSAGVDNKCSTSVAPYNH